MSGHKAGTGGRTDAVTARALDRDDTVPLWAQLQSDVRRRVRAGEFSEAFPPELRLVAEYRVSRHTVRQALRPLRAEGVVVAGRGRPPRLASPAEIEQPLGAVYSLFSSVEALGLEQRSEVRSYGVTADGVVAARLGLEESSPLVRIERLRLAGDEPLAVDEVWLPAELGVPLLGADLTHTSIYAELAARADVWITDGQERIRAVTPAPAHALALGIGSHAPVFAIDRLGCADGRPVEWRHTVVRGDRFALSASFSAGGYRRDPPPGATSGPPAT